MTHSQIPDNPAQLAPEFQSLFPAGVTAAVMHGPGDSSLLFPEEAACLGRAVPKRIQEFTAGRLCVRRALAAIGIADFALRSAPDRQPVWPDAIVGSISHTAGLCVAAVAFKREFYAIGADCEVVGHVTTDLWATILTPREAAWVDALPEAGQAAAAALIFSAKEAFYKCQYPVTGEWLDFHDLEIDVAEWGALEAGFSVAETRPLAATAAHFGGAVGRYRLCDGFVITGVAWNRHDP